MVASPAVLDMDDDRHRSGPAPQAICDQPFTLVRRSSPRSQPPSSSPGRLWQPLEYHQGAPVAFLMVEKLAGKLAGYSELALRFFPLMAGILALFVFYHLLRFALPARSIPLALVLFSLSPPLIYYSSEVKQYSVDVAVTLILLWAMAKTSSSRPAGRALLGLSALGASAIWFSHPASFVLAGDGAVLILVRAARRDWQGVRRMAWVLAVWSVSFVLFYFTSLRALSQDGTLLDFWARAFPPRPIWSISTGSWLIDTFFTDFRDLARVIPVLGEALLVVGCAALIRRNKLTFCLLAAPFLPLFCAAWLHKYPLHGRLLLFGAPILLLLVAQGTMRAYDVARVVSPPFAILLLAAVVAEPAWLAAKMLVHPDRGEDLKVALRYVRSHQRPGDICYVYYGAKYPFAYYSELYKLTENNAQMGTDCGRDANCYAADLERCAVVLGFGYFSPTSWLETIGMRSSFSAANSTRWGCGWTCIKPRAPAPICTTCVGP